MTDHATPVRHLLLIERLPGAKATMTIDGKPVRVVRIRVTPDQTEVLYEVTHAVSGQPDTPLHKENRDRR